jgi:glycosyltransferase involved in cell wall biosynthesis
MSEPRPRLLIFVIAYHAETTLREVLERIPQSVFAQNDCEILVVDDASEDRTFEIGHEYKASHPEIRMTVLRNEYNQGYGGNQKVGYWYAITEGFDFVAMIHGDGQYAPEELPRLMGPLLEGRADAVFGSRMTTRLGALKGGMPLYKFVGNRILSTAQNHLLGSRLSEFHSGYRIYSVAALQRLPFRLNSNDFHFDTEIIIQLLNGGARIVELPIPTYYGDEICRVNGLKYARDVMKATVANVLHRAGLLYQRRFDVEGANHIRHDLKLGYPSSHSYTLDAVAPGSSVLDIGSGPAGMARELVKKGCQVAVVDAARDAAGDAASDRAESAGDTGAIQVFTQDLNDEPGFEIQPYDTLLLLDVIEHLRDPEQFMDRLRTKFDHQPRTMILTTPNVAFIVQRLMLLVGQFNYGKRGVLDRTHTRLFTFRGLEQLMSDAGFRVQEVKGVPAPFPKALGDGMLGRAALRANLLLIRVSKTLFSYQIYVKASTTPDVEFVLKDTKAKSAGRRQWLERRAQVSGAVEGETSSSGVVLPLTRVLPGRG